MVHFCGARDALVGVTHECDYPRGVEELPHLTSSKLDHSMSSAEIDAAVGAHLTDSGSIYALDAELLEELAPDLIVTQGLCDVCSVTLDLVAEAATKLRCEPVILSLNPTSLREVLDDIVALGETLGHGDETRAKLSALEERLARVEEAVAGLPRPRVACIEWLDPPFSAGHWIPEMVGIAGGEETLASPGLPSTRLSWDEVLEASPEVLVLMPCGFDARRTIEEAARVLPRISGWEDLPAVRDGRVWAVDANAYFSRPAPRLVDGVEILARIFHPEVFPEAPDAAISNSASQQFS